jgi:uncharacterized protein (DUF2147 family)
MRLKLFLLVSLLLNVRPASAQNKSVENDIYGKWHSLENNLDIRVFNQNGEIKSEVIWFKLDNGMKSMAEWTDTKNPDKALRSRKILGLSVLKGMVYDVKGKTWEHGTIYDAMSGRYWDATAYITKDGLLKVKGYWHFKFIGRTMTFKRID